MSRALDYYFGRVDLADASGAPLLTNGTSQCNAELTAALLRQVAGIELQEALVYAWVRPCLLALHPGPPGLLRAGAMCLGARMPGKVLGICSWHAASLSPKN